MVEGSRPQVIAVAGTHEPEDGWPSPGSPLFQHLNRRGLDQAVGDGRPFDWTRDLDGFTLFSWMGVKPSRRDWQIGAESLRAWVIPPLAPERAIPRNRRHALSHSHGIELVLIAAARGLYIHTLIDVGGPIREDILEDYGEAARMNIGYWVHIYVHGRSDFWQWLGGLGDGNWDGLGQQRSELAMRDGRGMNIGLPKGLGHSRVLREPTMFHHLDGCIDLIKERDGRDD